MSECEEGGNLAPRNGDLRLPTAGKLRFKRGVGILKNI